VEQLVLYDLEERLRRTNMRKVIAGLFISLDGVVESPDKLKLVDSKTFSTGVLSLIYEPAQSE
jgi:hypothetical protein